MRKVMMVAAVVMLAGLALTACVQPLPAPDAGGSDAAQSEEITLYVGPELVDCVGVAPQQCMLVKENPDDEYTLFYGQIEGFEYEPGYEYELRVQVAPVENPPADGSSLKYTLIEVVNKTPVDGAGTEDAGQAELTLEGVNWQAVSYVDGEGQSQTPVAGAEPTALFENGAVNGTTGCNNYFGSYQISGNQLTIDENTGMTMMACPDPLMTQEQAYITALGSVTTYAIVDGQLQLSNADGQVVLTYVPLEPVTLVGTTWEAIGYNNGKEAVVSIIIGSQITALFGEDGKMSGDAGCNNYNAGYEADDANIKIGPAAATRMMCAEPEGVMDQEGLYLAALAMAEVYTIDGDRLQLRTAAGSLVADYRARAADAGDGGEPVSEELKTALGNMEYKSGFTQNGLALLENGEYSEDAAPGSASKTVVSLRDHSTTGELDGRPAVVTVLATSTGGAGTFFDLALVVEQDGKLVNVANATLGDRVRINSLAIMDNQIVVDMVNSGPDDAMCCPTQHLVRTYAYQNGELAQTSEEVLGKVEAEENADGGLVGPVWAWQGTQGGDDSVTTVNDPSRYTAQFMDDGTVSIKADCNQVSGNYTANDSQLTIEQPMASTMAMCPEDSQDQQFLQELSAVASYVIEEGNLFISMMADGGVMAFAPL